VGAVHRGIEAREHAHVAQEGPGGGGDPAVLPEAHGQEGSLGFRFIDRLKVTEPLYRQKDLNGEEL